jgi:hypothetical protein
VDIVTAENLHHGEWVHADDSGEVPEGEHTHKAYGVYEEATQTITLDSDLSFEKARETLLHESLHAMFSVVGLDNLIEASAPGLSEHIISTISPVMLAVIRDNPPLMRYLSEHQFVLDPSFTGAGS